MDHIEDDHGLGSSKLIGDDTCRWTTKGVCDGCEGNQCETCVAAELELGDGLEVTDDHKTAGSACEEHEPELVEFLRLEHLLPCEISNRCLGSCRRADNRSLRVVDELRKGKSDGKEQESEDPEGCEYAILMKEILAEWCDVDAGETESANYDACDETLLLRCEPLDSCRCRRGVAKTDTGSCKDTEREYEAWDALHEACKDTARSDEDAADCCDPTRTDLVLETARRNHHECE